MEKGAASKKKLGTSAQGTQLKSFLIIKTHISKYPTPPISIN